MLDSDLESMSLEQLREEVKSLRAAIRNHRDSSGHDLCWWVPELWLTLPERTLPTPEVPEPLEFIKGCVHYRLSLEDVKRVQGLKGATDERAASH